jgi:hypothetical protein
MRKVKAFAESFHNKIYQKFNYIIFINFNKCIIKNLKSASDGR